nr:MAG: NADH-quinone oxidoreductase subunit F [Bacteroidota bacterium]
MTNWKAYRPLLLPPIRGLDRIEVYEQHGGYEALRRVLAEWTPARVIEEVKASGLRGRGGAGFSTGLKWSFMPPPDGRPRYLCVNGDESEPGTFKDRQILEFNPHLLIEGALIAAYAIQATAIYLYIRGEYADWIDRVEVALLQARERGYIGERVLGTDWSIAFYVHRGAGAYICGEESALMESIEGKRAYPRQKPPFPAQRGLWGRPTTINNVETLANVPLIIRHGAEWYNQIGAPKHPGPILYGISGHVNRPGVYELPSGMPIETLIYEVAGGIRGGKRLKAVIPGGSSTPPLRADQIAGVTMDAESLRAAGSMMGTAGMVVLDEDTDMVRVLVRIAEFYHHESCGQCTPCREGTGWLVKILRRIERGEGKPADLELLLEICNQMEGRTVCALADAAAWPVRHTIQRFREEFEARCRGSLFSVPEPIPSTSQ